MALPVRDIDDHPIEPVGSQRRAWLIVAAVAIIHALAVWGYTGTFWSDQGRWLEEVSRFARGGVPYRDFAWTSPPFALWIVGGIARITGTSLSAIGATMVGLYLAIVALFLHHLRRLTPDLVLPIAVPSLLFALAYASRSGAPLPLGTVAPASPVGFLCLLGATAVMLDTVDRRSAASGAFAGLLAGLAVLSKHDYWFAGVYVLAAGSALLARRRASGPALLAPLAACTATVITGLGLAIAHAGPAPVMHMLLGSGQIERFAEATLPSAERLIVGISAAAALVLTAVTSLWLCLAIDDRTAKRWAGGMGLVFLTATAIHLGMSVAIGRDLMANGIQPLPTMIEETMYNSIQSGRGLVASAIAVFDERFEIQLFPVILSPVLLLVLIARWRAWHDRALANRLALLLGLCVVARGFRRADWYNVLLELPSYAMFLQLVCGPATHKAARSVRAALSVLTLLGIYSYISMGRGPLTLNGRWPVTTTHRGRVHWPPFEARVYRRADSLVSAADATGRRSLFAFGSSGGWNYYLDRPNPTPATGGLTAGPWSMDSVLAGLRRAEPPPLLLDNRYALRPTPASQANPLRWEPEPEPNVFTRIDRGPFLKLVAECGMANAADSTHFMIAVYDCARPRAAAATRPGSSP